MTQLVLNGMIGLLLGVSLRLCRTEDGEAVREALALRRRGVAKCLLWAAGMLALLMAGLTWLAVIDVDEIPVLPLTGRVLAGGAIAGAGLALAGYTPETALAGVGGGRFTEGLCAAAGCGMVALLPEAETLLTSAEAWFPPLRATLFRTTLDERFLFPGGFAGLGCMGLALCLVAVCLRQQQPPQRPSPAPTPAPVSVEPAQVQEETLVASLPGEEPVVVDTEEPPAGAEGGDAPDPS